jgi:hypothetical protein
MDTGQEAESKLVMAWFVSVILEMIMCMACNEIISRDVLCNICFAAKC